MTVSQSISHAQQPQKIVPYQSEIPYLYPNKKHGCVGDGLYVMVCVILCDVVCDGVYDVVCDIVCGGVGDGVSGE